MRAESVYVVVVGGADRDMKTLEAPDTRQGEHLFTVKPAGWMEMWRKGTPPPPKCKSTNSLSVHRRHPLIWAGARRRARL